MVRWAHPAVWLALTAAAALFAAGTSARRVARVAAVGLVLYGAFVLALILA